jgi:hypothetical protein
MPLKKSLRSDGRDGRMGGNRLVEADLYKPLQGYTSVYKGIGEKIKTSNNQH